MSRQETAVRQIDIPPQHQDKQPGEQTLMRPEPEADAEAYVGSGKLRDKVALVTGGDSGIGRSVAIAFAKEGADVAIVYFDEHEDAASARDKILEAGRECITIAGDIGDEAFCQRAVKQTVDELGKLNVLVNNAAEQHPQDDLEAITAEQLERTFRTNIFSMFYLTKAALKHMQPGRRDY